MPRPSKETMHNRIIRLQKDLNIEIIDIDYETCTFKCLVCNSIRTSSITTMYSNTAYQEYFHSTGCSKYYSDIIRQELGDKAYKKFAKMYNSAEQRCDNPNNICYEYYKGKFKFNDFPDYFNNCYNAFKDGIKQYGLDDLSIDRIENDKGYEPGNVRFIPMSINALNKDAIKAIAAYNVLTKQLLEAPNAVELTKKYFNVASSILRAYAKSGTLYLQRWHIFYTDEDNGLLEYYKEQSLISKLTGNTNVKEIKRFRDEYYFLCNSFKAPVTLEGITYSNNEAAFQAYQTTDTALRETFSSLSAKAAKIEGRKLQYRSDWEDVKINIMYAIVIAKFTQNEDLKIALLATGDAYLENTGSWVNRIWGTINGVGNNYLGKILMNVRSKLRSDS